MPAPCRICCPFLCCLQAAGELPPSPGCTERTCQHHWCCSVFWGKQKKVPWGYRGQEVPTAAHACQSPEQRRVQQCWKTNEKSILCCPVPASWPCVQPAAHSKALQGTAQGVCPVKSAPGMCPSSPSRSCSPPALRHQTLGTDLWSAQHVWWCSRGRKRWSDITQVFRDPAGLRCAPHVAVLSLSWSLESLCCLI